MDREQQWEDVASEIASAAPGGRIVVQPDMRIWAEERRKDLLSQSLAEENSACSISDELREDRF